MIKETRVIFNLGECYEQTKIINFSGKLKGIILRNSGKIDLNITSELGYLIYNELQHEGTDYFTVKFNPKNNVGHRFNFTTEDYIINEKLIINVCGMPMSTVLLILRYETLE